MGGSVRSKSILIPAIAPLFSVAVAHGATAPVFVTNTAAPGGGTITGFVSSSITQAQEIGVVAQFSNPNGFGLIRGNEAGSILIARTGVDYGTGTLVEVSASPMNGKDVFAAVLQPTGKPYGIYVSSYSSADPNVTITTLAQPSAAAPGGGSFSSIGGRVINASQTIAFSASLSDGSTGLWRVPSGGAVAQVARSGTIVVGGTGLDFGTFGSPAINGSAHLAFTAQVNTSQVGIFKFTTSMSEVTRSGSAAPGGGNFTTQFSRPVVADDGQVTFSATLSTGSGGIFRGSSLANLTALARSGASSGGGTFNSFSPPLNTGFDGYVVFAGTENFAGGTRAGIWRVPAASGAFTLTRIAAVGNPAPGGGTFSTISQPAAGGGGRVAFKANVGAGTGIFVTDGIETIQAAFTGTPLLGSSITNLDSTFGQDPGGFSPMDDSAQLAYQATLQNSQKAILLFTPDLHWRGLGTAGSVDSAGNWTLGLLPSSKNDVYLDPVGGGSFSGLEARGMRSFTIGGNGATTFSTPTSTFKINVTNALNVLAGSTFNVSRSSLNAGSVNNDGRLFVLENTGSFGIVTGNGTTSVGSTSTGTLTANSIRQDWLTINNSGRVKLNPASGSQRVSVLKTLELNGGILDVGNSALVIDYSTVSPLTTIAAKLKQGYGSGGWNSLGITTTSSPAGSRFGLGYAESSAVLGAGGGDFAGETVDETAVLIRYTLYGDANLDGKVNALDFNALASHYGSNSGWYDGNFNYDTAINSTDFSQLARNFGMTLTLPAAPLGSVVPEPTALVPALAAYLLRPRRSRAKTLS